MTEKAQKLVEVFGKKLALKVIDEMYNIAAENDNVKQLNLLLDTKQEIENFKKK